MGDAGRCRELISGSFVKCDTGAVGLRAGRFFRKAEMAERGEVRNWITSRGFGFIRPDCYGDDVFLHARAFRPLVDTVRIGTRVEYETESGPDGRVRAKSARFI